MRYQDLPADWPLDSNIIRRGMSSNTFGMVRHYSDGRPKPHAGWDFFAPTGTPCYAVMDGEVVFTGPRGDYGNVIVIKLTGTDKFAAYAHLDEIEVSPHQHVKLGQQIGKTGCSGNAMGMMGEDQHLHFELRTVALPGLGLEGRVSPMELFGSVPMHVAAKRGVA